MKRSEAISLIKKALSCTRTWENDDIRAGVILTSIEGCGMLPPESYNPNMGGFVGSEMGIYENEWEPEEDPVLEFDTVNPKDIETLQKIAGVKDLELEEKE